MPDSPWLRRVMRLWAQWGHVGGVAIFGVVAVAYPCWWTALIVAIAAVVYAALEAYSSETRRLTLDYFAGEDRLRALLREKEADRG